MAPCSSFKDRTPLHSWFKVIIQVLNREEPRYPFQFGDREMGSCFYWWDLVEINNSGKFDYDSVKNNEKPLYPQEILHHGFQQLELQTINNFLYYSPKKKSNGAKFDEEESHKCGAGLCPIHRVPNTSFKNDEPVDCSRVQHHYA
ncbi:unnamed protein product [Xylocopa violacea]|uniref:Uncharacterized protein n=1 Tax=Xylocopa violacea TaxID=135666 RepID=A0ABP1N0K5_XYLVO